MADDREDTLLFVVGENPSLRHLKPHIMLCVYAKDYVSRLEEGQKKVEPLRFRGLGSEPHILYDM